MNMRKVQKLISRYFQIDVSYMPFIKKHMTRRTILMGHLPFSKEHHFKTFVFQFQSIGKVSSSIAFVDCNDNQNSELVFGETSLAITFDSMHQ